MALTPGTRLGPYDIVALIGVGGMGEVYRATDTNLKRAVAIKVLPASVAADADRLARFQREAEVLAALNHPNIAAIYGLERAGATTALVIELVEGPTLADRLAAGGPQGPPLRSSGRSAGSSDPAIPLVEALDIARQIAEALEAAHEQGIIHRDLKPANIKVRSDGKVKVLDFGLAKAMEGGAGRAGEAGRAGGLSQSPTITTPAMTQAGMILGTAAYMSPEQARGKPVDKRADIWAFGAVLFEMLTGQRAFEDEDVSLTLSKVLQREPDFDALPSTVPARVRQALRVCLRKDPKQRAGDIRDVRLVLEGAFDPVSVDPPQTAGAPQPVAWRRALLLALAASLATGVIVGVAVRGLAPEQGHAVSRFEYQIPASQPLRNTGRPVMAFSRDGRRIVYNTAQGLYLREMDDLDAHLMSGTQTEGTNPFFSPDGQWVGYWQAGQFKRIAVRGGAPVTIGPANDNPYGVSWETDDTILFGQTKGIMRLPVAGGAPQLVIPAKDREQFDGPQLLPDGDSVLFSVTSTTSSSRWDEAQVVVQSLRTGERTVVLQSGSDARYLPTGYLVYALKDSLFAVPFDSDRHRVTGAAVPVAQQITRANGAATATANYGVSDDGTLVYVKSTSASLRATLTWVTRDGRATPLSTSTLERPRNPRLSPDGRRVALIAADDLWVYDAGGRPPIKLTADGGHYSPVWTPDGQRLVYEAGGLKPTLLVLPADGSSEKPQAVSIEGHFHPYGFSMGGTELVAVRLGATGASSADIVRWAIAKPDVLQPVVETPAQEGFDGTMLSPDGRWLAYASNQTGQQEIWVRPFPGPGAAVRISPGGGTEPVWARSGRELFYLEGTKMMAATVTASDTFNFSAPIRLFDYKYLMSSQPPSYDVAPDGRFLMLDPIGGDAEAARPQIIVVQHWTQEVARLAATR